MSTTDELVSYIGYGMGVSEIETKTSTSPSKLLRALQSPQMARRLQSEELLGRARMRLLAGKHLDRAIRGLVNLIDVAEPEAARKACLVLIAAATGINLANPAVKVYPDDVVDAWQLMDCPEEKARRQEDDRRERENLEHAAYVQSLEDLIARWEHHPPATAPTGDVVAQVGAAVKHTMDGRYRDEDAEGELPGPPVPNPAYAADWEMREWPWQGPDRPAEAGAPAESSAPGAAAATGGAADDDDGPDDPDDDPDDDGPGSGMAAPPPDEDGAGDDDDPEDADEDGAAADDGAVRAAPKEKGGTRKHRSSQPTRPSQPMPSTPAENMLPQTTRKHGTRRKEVFKSGPECQNPADSGRPAGAENSQGAPDSGLANGRPAGAPAKGGSPSRRAGRGRRRARAE